MLAEQGLALISDDQEWQNPLCLSAETCSLQAVCFGLSARS